MRIVTSVPFNPLQAFARLALDPTFTERVPPYDIVRVDGGRMELRFAVAGLEAGDLEVEIEGDMLRIAASGKPDDAGVVFIRRSISRPEFECRFKLAAHVTVANSRLVNGILVVALQVEKPASDARRVEIQAAA